MENSQDELKVLISKWQTAYYLSQAILDDYAEHIAKAEGITADEIKKRVTDLAQKKLDNSKLK